MLVGDSGVGKSSIVSCVCFGEVERKHLATIGVDFHSTNTTINGTRVKMQIVRYARRGALLSQPSTAALPPKAGMRRHCAIFAPPSPPPPTPWP